MTGDRTNLTLLPVTCPDCGGSLYWDDGKGVDAPPGYTCHNGCGYCDLADSPLDAIKQERVRVWRSAVI